MRYRHLWAFKPNERKQYMGAMDEDVQKWGVCAAPTLFPASQTGDKISDGPRSDVKETQIIDVVKDFPWTRSPQEARIDVPQLILREEKILVNPMVNTIANNLSVGVEKVGRFATKMEADNKDGMMSKILGGAFQAGSGVMNIAESGKLGESGKAAADAMRYVLKSDGTVMSTVNKLYITEETGFKYKFPYLSDRASTRNNAFSPGGTSGGSNVGTPLFHEMFQNVSEVVSKAATSFNIMEPGTYIDNPGMYDYGSNPMKTYSVSIPLINTSNDFQDVISNWQLIFMLIYQNTPNRITRDLIDPPRLYEAHIKGVWYSRWTYIQSLSIDFLGPTRRMIIPVPIVNQSDSGEESTELFNCETVIPDAYQLNLTVSEIVPESQNSLYAMLHQKPSVVTVTKDNKGLSTIPAYDADPSSSQPAAPGGSSSKLGKLKKIAGTALQVAGGVAAVAATVKGLKR
jgi:hypothetical protein